ncbi:hypothetical protein ACFX13_001306 [Malus domestica]
MGGTGCSTGQILGVFASHLPPGTVPNSEDVWLEASRLATSREEKWLAAAVTATLETLQEAYAATPNSKEILLPASKLEFENKKPERVRMLLVKARQEGEGERLGERLDNLGNAKEACNLHLKQCPKSIPLWLSLASLEERTNGLSKANACSSYHVPEEDP